MTDDQIIAAAKLVRDGGHWNQIDIINFGRLIALAEREACAVTAWSAGMDAHNNAAGLPCDAREIGAQCASTIRARGKK